MSVYETHLPLAFPHSYEVHTTFAGVAAGALLGGHSSFAVTADPKDAEHRILWLSDVSRIALLDVLRLSGYATREGHWRGAVPE